MNMAIPVELATVGVQRPENADGQALLLGCVQQVVGSQGEQGTEKPAVDLKQRPQGISGRVKVPCTRCIRQASHHGGNPQVSGFFFPQIGHPRPLQL